MNLGTHKGLVWFGGFYGTSTQHKSYRADDIAVSLNYMKNGGRMRHTLV